MLQIIFTSSANLQASPTISQESWSFFIQTMILPSPLILSVSTGTTDQKTFNGKLPTRASFSRQCILIAAHLPPFVASATFSIDRRSKMSTNSANAGIASISKRCLTGIFTVTTTSYRPTRSATSLRRYGKYWSIGGSIS